MGAHPSTIVAGAADDAYAAPACVALLSAATSTPEPLPCLFLDAGCSASTLARLRAAFERHAVPLVVQPVDELLAGLHVEAYVSRATYGSLVAARFAAELAERTLFVDCDTLTLGTVAPLLETDLRGRAVGAVQDARLHYVSGPRGVPDWEGRGIPPSLAYFNAGVLLIDNAAWLEQALDERALTMLRERPGEFPIVEQGVLNALLRGEWWPLEPQWNVWARAALAIRVGDLVLTRRDARTLPPSAIVHFVDRFKPWQPDYPPSTYRRLYRQAHRRFASGFPEPEHLNVARWVLRRRRMIRSWSVST